MTLRRAHRQVRGLGAAGLLRRRPLRALAGGLTVIAVLAVTALPAFANAANPVAPSTGTGTPINATVQTNANGSIKVLTGSVAVTVNGTWNWLSQTGCSSRFGVGWAVDWFGVSPSAIVGTTGLPIKNTNLLFHV